MTSESERATGPRSRPAGIRRWVVALSLLGASPVSGELAAPPHPVDEVKAEFVERITGFVEWPREALGDPTRPFSLCIVGRGSILPYLERIARERRIKERPVHLHRLSADNDLEACHVVFISSSASGDLADILARIEGKPVLSMGDTPNFGRRGVLVNLFQSGDHIRFSVNASGARRSGLRLSSKLVGLAASLEGE